MVIQYLIQSMLLIMCELKDVITILLLKCNRSVNKY
jgi:hypothetical protein